VKIRESALDDYDSIREVHKNAFGDSEGPVISQLACDILEDDTAKPLLSLVAEIDNNIVGHVIFSAVKLEDTSEDIPAYILAPLAVAQEHQCKGIGKSLVNKGLEDLKQSGAELLFVYGDPNYYSQYGFEQAKLYDFKSPYELDYHEAWMVLGLNQESLKTGAGIVKCALSLSSEEHW